MTRKRLLEVTAFAALLLTLAGLGGTLYFRRVSQKKLDDRLLHAVLEEDPGTAADLLARGADANTTDGKVSVLWYAAQEGDAPLIELLLANGADPNRKTPGGNLPLVDATRGGLAVSVRALLEHGADPNARGSSGETALITAARLGHGEIVKALLEKRAQVDVRDDGGSTALIWAAERGRGAIVEALLAAGADPRVKDDKGRTAAKRAAQKGHRDLARRLREEAARESPGRTTP